MPQPYSLDGMNDPDGLVAIEHGAAPLRVHGADAPPWRDRFWHPRFWRELVMITGLYFTYQAIGDYTSGSHALALADALAEVNLERTLGIFTERYVQSVALVMPGLAQFSDDYYATVHFAMPIVVLVWLWWRFPARYRVWRNALAWLTLIGFVVFVAFPVLPPRLLPASFGFVDTMKTLGGAGQLDAALLSDVGASYAAMPSLHIAWSVWCVAAMYPTLGRRWLKALLLADPILTTVVVIVTANHFYVDVIAGVIVAAMGVGLARVSWMRLCRAVAGKICSRRGVASRVGEARRG